ncbi:MAG: GntR family transcriptional regulator, partial [Sedimentibacter sp.]
AAMLTINPNTIQKAYKNLEENNYVYTVKGKGNFVKNSDELKNIHIKNMEELLEKTIVSLKELGINDDKIIDSVNKTLSTNMD